MKAPIRDHDKYLSELRKSMDEKLFFLDYLPPEINTLVDIGCADGSLLQEAHRRRPFKMLGGADNNEEFLSRAFSSIKQIEDVKFAFFETIRGLWCKDYFDNEDSVVNVSSVLHEVPFREVFPLHLPNVKFFPEYITIRDMYRRAFDCIPFVPDEIREKLFDSPVGGKRAEAYFGHPSNIISMSEVKEFLLKYRWDNWERESQEQYLSFCADDLSHWLLNDRYGCIHREEYTPPFIKEQVLKDFGIELDCTHINLIYKRIPKELMYHNASHSLFSNQR